MTSKDIRNNPLFLRNEFEVEGKWGFPVIHKQELDLRNIELISCADVSKSDTKNLHKGVHFFVDDFRFESLYWTFRDNSTTVPEGRRAVPLETACCRLVNYSYGDLRIPRPLHSRRKALWVWQGFFEY